MVQDQIKGLRSFSDGEVARFHDVLQPQGFFEVDGQRFSSHSHEDDVRLLVLTVLGILGLPASASSFRLNNNHFRLRPWRTAREFLPHCRLKSEKMKVALFSSMSKINVFFLKTSVKIVLTAKARHLFLYISCLCYIYSEAKTYYYLSNMKIRG